MRPDDRYPLHSEMLAMTEQLIGEYSGAVPAGVVIDCVARTREHLVRTGVRHGLTAATEAAVRVRLAHRVRLASSGSARVAVA